MNRNKVLLALLMTFFVVSAALAQDAPQAPPQRGADPAQLPVIRNNVLDLVPVLGGLTLQTQENTTPGQRGAGGRGARSGGPDATSPDVLNELQLRLQAVRNPNPVNTTVSTGRGLLVSPNSGAWWTNAEILTRLGLTDDQKLKIERVFENNRQNLTTTKTNLEREETQLARLLDAEQLDRGSVTSQIYKVVQTRGEMEKVNALMTMEMREVLTRAQWMQLQVQQSVNVSVGATGGLGRGGRSGGPAAPGGLGIAPPPAPTAPGRGQRGQ